MKLNWFYVLIAILFTGMLIISIRYFRGAGGSLVGVTFAKEYKINTGKSAQVRTINVISGQEVKEGDLLVELVSSDLEMDIDKLSTRISTLFNERLERTKLVNAEIAYIKAAEGVEMEEINTEIVESESELQLNQNLTREFTKAQKSETSDNPLKGKVALLKQQLVKREEAMAIKVKNVIQQNETTQNLLNNQIKLLGRELELLQQEKNNLKKYATTAGVVENVYVKQGEHADAYTSLLSINPTHPTTVVGYSLGRSGVLPVGAEVMVRSFEYQNSSIEGTVIGYGSVVPLPDILQKSTAVKAFGREIFIEIAPQNGFASGEKVLIR